MLGHRLDIMGAGDTRTARLQAFAKAILVAMLGMAALLGLYLVLLTLVAGWGFTLEQWRTYWPYVIALALGFGIQAGLYAWLRLGMQARHAGKVVAVTGTTSGVAMVSCCTHYLANLLPALGATGVVSLVGQYQVELFWFGLAANLAGIVFIGRRVAQFEKEA